MANTTRLVVGNRRTVESRMQVEDAEPGHAHEGRHGAFTNGNHLGRPR